MFALCLAHKKLFDGRNYALTLFHKEWRKDSFFSCLSMALFNEDSHRVHIRAHCLYHFIELVFEDPIHKDERIEAFLERPFFTLREGAYEHRAVQMLFKRSRKSLGGAKTCFNRSRDAFKRVCLEFVEHNSVIGVVTCRFTFCFLVATLYPAQIHLYDEIGDSVYMQPPIAEGSRKGQTPQELSDEIACRSHHIFIWRQKRKFRLLVPQIVRPEETRLSCLARMQKQHDYKYQLRASSQKKTNTHVCMLTPKKVGESVLHLCDVPKRPVEKGIVYQIYPARVNEYILQVAENETLYVFLVREDDIDPAPYVECVYELTHDLQYPYFMLPKDARQIAVLTTEKERNEALKEAQQLC